MTAPHDLRLERLSDRNGRRSDHFGEIARVGSPVADLSIERESELTREALNNAVYSGPGAIEWLRGLRRAVLAWLSSGEPAPQVPIARDAIHAGEPRSRTG